jgi:F-type H+-transporting ATPase subunit b
LGEAMGALGINGPFLLSQIVNFLILFVALRFLLWKPLLQRLDERRQLLEKEKADAAVLEQARAGIETEREGALEGARKEADELVAGARLQANALQEQAVQEANQEADRIVAHAREDAEEERNRMLGEMRGQIAALATAAAQRIIGASLDEQQQRDLVDAFFSGVREGRVEVLPETLTTVQGPVVVTSAIPLTGDEEVAIRQELASRAGEDVAVSFKVDPDVLGGLILRAGDRVIDGSVVGQLERLQESLL